MPDSESSTGTDKEVAVENLPTVFRESRAEDREIAADTVEQCIGDRTNVAGGGGVKSERYLKKRCRQPAARKKRAGRRDCRTASDARIERVFSAKTTASASAASAGGRPASGKPIRSMVLRPEATRVSARSLAPVKSSATDPKRRDIIGLFMSRSEFEAFAANVVANDSIEAAFVARKAETVRAGGEDEDAAGQLFTIALIPSSELPADRFAAASPADSFQRCVHLTHACCNAGQTEQRISPSASLGNSKAYKRHSTATRGEISQSSVSGSTGQMASTPLSGSPGPGK